MRTRRRAMSKDVINVQECDHLKRSLNSHAQIENGFSNEILTIIIVIEKNFLC